MAQAWHASLVDLLFPLPQKSWWVVWDVTVAPLHFPQRNLDIYCRRAKSASHSYRSCCWWFTLLCILQLTDEVVAEAFPGVQSLDELRQALAESTAAQREEDQRDKIHEALIKVGYPVPPCPLHQSRHDPKAVQHRLLYLTHLKPKSA